MKWEKDDYWVTDEDYMVDLDFVTASLQTTYWAENRPREIVEASIRNSVFLSMFDKSKQIGFARVVSDKATFAWLADVFIDPAYRGKGLGEWIVSCALEHPSTHVGLNLLATRDAHDLYRKFGYEDFGCMALRDHGAPEPEE